MRNAFSKAIVTAAAQDARILLLTGDHGYALFDDFRRAAPAQFINAGVAEQNMVGVAAGLAKAGFRPIVYGLSAFVPVRVLEQIKLDVCYERLPVVFIGDGAGLVYSSLGSSHQSTEDIAVLRPIPHIQILSPADRYEMTYAMEHALKFEGPTYIRMGKADLGDVHEHAVTAPLGALIPCYQNDDYSIALIATGSMVGTALSLAKASGVEKISVWSTPSISPISHVQINEIARKASTVMVIEEHSTAGGLGGQIAEIVGEMEGSRARVLRFGTGTKFSERCGSYGYLLQEHGIDLATLRQRLSSLGVA